jgi:two-component system chemotaxis response regulator CheY
MQPEIPAGARAAPHVLAVDDATVVRLYYRHILEAVGLRVTEAINGLEAMEHVLQQTVDLCVVDVNMPIMDGYTFIRTLRREPATASIPALMTSTQASEADRRKALLAGANFYLVKPVSQIRLAAIACAMLGLPAPDAAAPASVPPASLP